MSSRNPTGTPTTQENLLQLTSSDSGGPVLLLGGHPVDITNLRLSLIQRDFTSSDYEALLDLDAAPPCHTGEGREVSDTMLADLPRRSHRKCVSALPQ